MLRDKKSLQRWCEAERRTLKTPNKNDDKIRKLFSGSDVQIIYDGGSTPGNSRTIKPQRVFKKKGYDSIYVEAYCHNRGGIRTFRLDRIRFHSPPDLRDRRISQPPQSVPKSTSNWVFKLAAIVLLLLIINLIRFLIQN